MKVNKVLTDILKERSRQERLWGEQSHTPTYWLPILAEEFGEVAKEICEMQFNQAKSENYRVELVQLAAVAVAMIESLDRSKSNE